MEESASTGPEGRVSKDPRGDHREFEGHTEEGRASPATRATGRGKRHRWKRKLSRHAGYVLGRLLHAIVSRIPFSASRAASWILGSGAYVVLSRDRELAVRNLGRVYGHERSPSEIRALARQVFRHSASVYVEWAILRRWPSERLHAVFQKVAAALQETQRTVLSTGTGVVGLTAHLGNWEILSLFCSRFTPGLLVPVANRIYFRKYHDFIHRLRSETGLEVVYNDESARKIIRAVREGHLLGLLPDQEVRTNASVFVDFFGLPAQTASFPVRLARMLGVKMTMVLLVREGRGYRVIDRGLFDVPRTDDERSDILHGTQLWTRMLEEEIRRRPEQWTWMHNRWHGTPDRPRRHLDRGHRMR